jgi:integrase
MRRSGAKNAVGGVSFAKPNHFSPASRPPSSTLAQLRKDAIALIDASKSTGTTRGYRLAIRNHWIPYCRLIGVSPSTVPSPLNLVDFVPWCGRRLKDVDKILSAVRWFYMLNQDDWDRLRKNYLVVAALSGLAISRPRTVKRSPPVLPAHIRSFVDIALRPEASYNDLLAATIATVAFGAMMRLGELVLPTHIDDRDSRKYIKRGSVQCDSSSFSFFLPYHKADRLWHGSHVTVVRENSVEGVDFVKLFQLYLRRRDAFHPSSPFLFLRQDGSVPTRLFFTTRLAAIAPTVTGHGLRAGGATYLASRGVRPDVIQRIGRWASDTWTIYFRDNPAVAAAVQRVDLTLGDRSLA